MKAVSDIEMIQSHMSKIFNSQTLPGNIYVKSGNSGQKLLFLTNIKKTKETKNCSDIGFISIITKNAKLKYP